MSRHPLTTWLPRLAAATVLLALAGPAMADLPAAAATTPGAERPLGPVVNVAVEIGIGVLVLGTVLCLYRILRGPSLPDRVLATDALALHVVGLVVALAIYLRTTDFLDVALVVAIIGFAGTLAFAQYIAAKGDDEPDSAGDTGGAAGSGAERGEP